MNQWISVKDRLPEDGQEVIAYCTTICKTLVGVFCGYRERGPGNFRWLLFGANGLKYNVTKVSHWMPLPEPPETE